MTEYVIEQHPFRIIITIEIENVEEKACKEAEEEWVKSFRSDWRKFCYRNEMPFRVFAVVARAAKGGEIEGIYGYRPTIDEFLVQIDNILEIRFVGEKTLQCIVAAWEKENPE